MSKLNEWHGTCREWYTLEADVRELKKYAPNKAPPELGYIDLVGDVVKGTLDILHYNYFERGEKFLHPTHQHEEGSTRCPSQLQLCR